MEIVKKINNISLFEKYNYSIFDPTLDLSILRYLDSEGVIYISIGLDYFEDKNYTPILLDLRQLNKNQIIYIVKNYVENFNYDNEKLIDKISLMNVFFYTELEIEILIKYIIEIMKHDGKVFRFYDSRNFMYINIYLNRIRRKNIEMITSEKWCFSFNGEFFELKIVNDLFEFYKMQKVEFNEMGNFVKKINQYHELMRIKEKI